VLPDSKTVFPPAVQLTGIQPVYPPPLVGENVENEGGVKNSISEFDKGGKSLTLSLVVKNLFFRKGRNMATKVKTL